MATVPAELTTTTKMPILMAEMIPTFRPVVAAAMFLVMIAIIVSLMYSLLPVVAVVAFLVTVVMVVGVC